MASWNFPDVRAGDTIEYSPGSGNGTWQPALVANVTRDQICIYVLEGSGNGRRAIPQHDGVIHEDDPRLNDPRYADTMNQDSEQGRGVFRLTTRQLDREQLALDVQSIKAQLKANLADKRKAAPSTRRSKESVKDVRDPVATV